MGDVCQGGAYDGMQIYGEEDRISCVRNEGRIVSSSSGRGCGATSTAAMHSDTTAGLGALGALRNIRDFAEGHPLMQELIVLNHEIAPAIETLRSSNDNPALVQELTTALVELAALATGITDESSTDLIYTPELHDRITRLLSELHELTPTDALHGSIARTLRHAEPFIGMSTRKMAEALATHEVISLPIIGDGPSKNIETWAKMYYMYPIGDIDVNQPHLADLIAVENADRAITNKATELGSLPGSPIHNTRTVPGGYMREFNGCDIYYAEGRGAFEVHGDIRAKYDFLNGASGILGLPVTDETATPDGRGRYNHFVNGGSIYWTPTTGPMMVRARIRDLWAQQGWEGGPMGYPVEDEYRLPGLYPSDQPDLAWSLFENGVIVRKGNAVAPAMAADILPDALKGLLRTLFDRALKAQDGDLGLEAAVDLVSVSDWHYGIWSAGSRIVTFRLHGFYDNGALPDTTFEVELSLRFTTAWITAFTAPPYKSIIAALDRLNVHTSGLGSGTLAKGLSDGIWTTFYRGGAQQGYPEVPDGAIFMADFPTGVNQGGTGNIDVIDVLTTAAGGLQILVNPIPPSFGQLRRYIAQNRIDGFLESF